MFLKIVPASKTFSATTIVECDRVEYRLAFGTATEVAAEAALFLEPPSDEEGIEPHWSTRVGYNREALEPGDSLIRAALITANTDGKPARLVAAFESTVYVMNDRGVTVDKIQATHKL